MVFSLLVGWTRVSGEELLGACLHNGDQVPGGLGGSGSGRGGTERSPSLLRMDLEREGVV